MTIWEKTNKKKNGLVINPELSGVYLVDTVHRLYVLVS